MERVRRFFVALGGERVLLPASLLQRWPELAQVRWRRGGLPPRIGGWCLGHGSVAAITLWRTVFLAPQTVLSAPLLLHEFRHVQQFSASRLFPARYLWESLRRGYAQNRYEQEADAFACAQKIGAWPPVSLFPAEKGKQVARPRFSARLTPKLPQK